MPTRKSAVNVRWWWKRGRWGWWWSATSAVESRLLYPGLVNLVIHFQLTPVFVSLLAQYKIYDWANFDDLFAALQLCSWWLFSQSKYQLQIHTNSTTRINQLIIKTVLHRGVLYCNVLSQVHLWQGANQLHPNWVWQVPLHSSAQPKPESPLYRWKPNTWKTENLHGFSQCGTHRAVLTLTLCVLFPTQR